MLEIANTIADDGLMINTRPAPPTPTGSATSRGAPDTQWIDVRAAAAEGRWIPEEGRALDRLLAYVAAAGVRLRDRHHPLSATSPTASPNSPPAPGLRGLRAGTIHRAQGKQAKIVILILGSDPISPGARSWATSTPNLLNVAVSRAQHRLIVIGDRRAWMTHRHFDNLARHLAPHQAGPGEHPRRSRPTPLDAPTAGNPR
jgi:hypothetical protein